MFILPTRLVSASSTIGRESEASGEQRGCRAPWSVEIVHGQGASAESMWFAREVSVGNSGTVAGDEDSRRHMMKSW
jgi:hypothetical protein